MAHIISTNTTDLSESVLKEELRRKKDNTEASLHGCRIENYEMYRESKYRGDLLLLALALASFLFGLFVMTSWSW